MKLNKLYAYLLLLLVILFSCGVSTIEGMDGASAYDPGTTAYMDGYYEGESRAKHLIEDDLDENTNGDGPDKPYPYNDPSHHHHGGGYPPNGFDPHTHPGQDTPMLKTDQKRERKDDKRERKDDKRERKDDKRERKDDKREWKDDKREWKDDKREWKDDTREWENDTRGWENGSPEEDFDNMYILKSQVVPPVCPACPQTTGCPKKKACQPCAPCARCPEPSFDCKKVPNYNAIGSNALPMAYLNSFSAF